MDVFDHVVRAVDGRIALAPVLAHFGHALGIPQGTATAERLAAVGVHRFVLRSAAVGNRIDDRLGGNRLVPHQHRVDQRHAGSLLDLGPSLRRQRTGRPVVQVAHDVALDDAHRRLVPILRDDGQHRLQPREQLVGFLRGKVGVDQKVLALEIGRPGGRFDCPLDRRRVGRAGQADADALRAGGRSGSGLFGSADRASRLRVLGRAQGASPGGGHNRNGHCHKQHESRPPRRSAATGRRGMPRSVASGN